MAILNASAARDYPVEYKRPRTIFHTQSAAKCFLLPKLFLPTVRKNCSSDLKKFSRSLEHLFQQRKVRRIFGNRMLF